MPELPEVQTVITVLKPIVKGHTITKIDVLRKSTIQTDIDEFVKTLTGKTFLDVTRIGKFIIFHLNEDVTFVSHLRMEGKYFELEEKEPNTKYARVVFHLDNNHKICYDDSRCFGMMKLSTEKEYRNLKDIAQLGPEPFDIKDVNYLVDRTKKSHLPIKSTLLDQTLMTGLGNIYADEVLFASKIHPLTETKDITKKEWQIIVKNAVDILNAAIQSGGSTIKSYHPGKDIDGNFQVNLKAYGKGDEPCPRCGHIMRFMKVGGRGSTYCPNCQQRVTDQILVAIYGKVASGKSTVLEEFKAKGYDTVSSDEVIAELYKDPAVVKQLEKTLGISLDVNDAKEGVRIHLKDNPKDIKKIEKVLHPLVKKYVQKAIILSKKPLLVAEIPLLYESKMDTMFDVIIAVKVNEKKQLEMLNKRNPTTASLLKKINEKSAFDKNYQKADFVIENNSSKESLIKKTDEIINKVTSRL